MAIEVVVPRLGWSMDEGTFGEWLIRDGAFVERGQALFVLEGEKSAQDIESFDQGILRIPPDAPQPGDTVKVGQVLAFLVDEGEPAPFDQVAPSAAKPPAATRTEITVETHAREVAGAGPERQASVATPGRVAASPRARRLAAQTGIDWTHLPGSGSGGRIRERDVAAAAKRQAGTAPAELPAASGAAADAIGGQRSVVVSAMRRTIAARMSAGVHEAAPVTLTTRCNATNLVSLREQFRAAGNDANAVVPGYNDLIVKLTATALMRHPLLRAQWNDRQLIVPEGIHIAVAVDTEAGLLAPVLRDADRLTLRQVVSASRQLAELARRGELSAEQMQGGVFTVTNLGMFGVDAFTPIINLPQSAILGVGRIAREAAVINDHIVPCDQLTLSLTFDHRVLDGAPAARFLNDLRQGIEQPGAWLVP